MERAAEPAMGAAAKLTLCFCRLTKCSFGIQARFMRQLYCTVAMPRFTYTTDVWYMPVTQGMQGTKASGSVRVTRQLA